MTAAFSLWWVWISIALALATLEVLLPGFIFLGIALAAALFGLAMLAMPAVMTTLPVSAMMAIFAGLSLLCWLGLRTAFRTQSSGSKTITHDVND
ncbi:MAG: hypothetical protein AAFY38_02060 [Pseudomonadota bacterium]